MSTHFTASTVREPALTLPRAYALWATVLAAVLGGALLFVVGFAGSHTIHEAAHDARHSLNFPCH